MLNYSKLSFPGNPVLWVILFAIASILVETVSAQEQPQPKKKAALFGASGAVGSEVLQALASQGSFWDEVILVGRRELELSALMETLKSGPTVTQVVLPSLADVDSNPNFQGSEFTVDACFIATGSGTPMDSTLSDWLSVEVEMTAAMARLCKSMEAQYIGVLSEPNAENGASPFSEDELKSQGSSEEKVLGWWGMLVHYDRVMGLKEQAVQSVNIPLVSLYQPSNIVTEEIRYGLFEKVLRAILPFVDPILPSKWHSVHARLLGMAIVGDAVERLTGTQGHGDTTQIKTYVDFVHLAGEEFEKITKEESKTEL